MIQETIVTTCSTDGQPHIAPMGIHLQEDYRIILPFRPSTTLDNLLATGHAVLNHTDDVRVFAGCLTGRMDWPLLPTESFEGVRLAAALAHDELELVRVEEDELRPRLLCKSVYEAAHAPFRGFNRAQFAVLEAAILVSRLGRLPQEKIETELQYLRVILGKCAGQRELEAWAWLMDTIAAHLAETNL
jgi:hypothetical protein